MDLVVGIIVIAAIVALIVWLALRNKKSAWTGVLQSKSTSQSTDEDGNTTTYYHLKVVHDGSGKVKSHSVNPKVYQQFEVGDKVVKTAGAFGLTKG